MKQPGVLLLAISLGETSPQRFPMSAYKPALHLATAYTGWATIPDTVDRFNLSQPLSLEAPVVDVWGLFHQRSRTFGKTTGFDGNETCTEIVYTNETFKYQESERWSSWARSFGKRWISAHGSRFSTLASHFEGVA
jgi:hypothetical protein